MKKAFTFFKKDIENLEQTKRKVKYKYEIIKNFIISNTFSNNGIIFIGNTYLVYITKWYCDMSLYEFIKL